MFCYEVQYRYVSDFKEVACGINVHVTFLCIPHELDFHLFFANTTHNENNPALPTRRDWKKYTRKVAREIPIEE